MALSRVAIGLGSNVGDRLGFLNRACELLPMRVGLAEFRVSCLYETPPWGYEDQSKFLNGVLTGVSSLVPKQLLDALKQLEVELGRQARFHYGPREIDLDILAMEEAVVESEELTIPHPQLLQREFVLRPLNDVWPDWRHPRVQQTVADLWEGWKENKPVCSTAFASLLLDRSIR